MFLKQLKLIIVISAMILQIRAQEDYEYYDTENYYEEPELIEFCHDIEIGSFIPSPRGERYYIFCDEIKNKSYEAKCPDNVPIFKDGICDKETITTTIKPITTTKRITTSPNSKKTTPVKTTKSTTRKTSTIKPTTKPTTSTTIKKLTTTASVTTTLHPDFCPINDNKNYVVFLPSQKNCFEYFICYHGNPLPMYCANKLHYNPITYKCDFPEKVQCKINELVKPFPKCTKTSIQIEFYKHPDNCNYFLCCIFGNMFVQQCPYLHHWDFMTKSCIPKHMSTCKNNNRIY